MSYPDSESDFGVPRKTKKSKPLKPRSTLVEMTSPEAEQTGKDDTSEISLTIASLKDLVSKPDREIVELSDEEKFHNKIFILGCLTNIEILFARQNYKD
jgi:hypothetical protein